MKNSIKLVSCLLGALLFGTVFAGCNNSAERKTVYELPHYDGSYYAEDSELPDYNEDLWYRNNTNTDGADPMVLDNTAVDGRFYRYSGNVASSSTDLVHWINHGPVIVLDEGWTDLWASEVVYEDATDDGKELITIKKYFLLQHYRTPKNKTNYTSSRQGFKLSQYNIADGESEEDFWKREMLTILDSKWSDLLQSEMVGVRKHAIDTNMSFMMIIKTDSEFCINDIGYVTERIPVKIAKEKEQEYIKAAKEIGKELYGRDNLDEVARREIANQSSYLDNFELYPISSNCAVLFVPPVWKYAVIDPTIITTMDLFSPILMKYLVLPRNEYVNADKMIKQEDIPKYMDEADKFGYKIQKVTDEETIYLNTLTMNEAYCYLGVKTPKVFIPSVRMYNYLMSSGEKNIHHNYNGFVDLLSKIN